jgi:hypothetical protein
LARDISFSRSLDFMTILSNEENDSRVNSVLDRFCIDILPGIRHNIECLTLEPSLIERVLYTGEYPKLLKLTLVNLKLEIASRILIGMYLITPFHNKKKQKLFIYIFRRIMIDYKVKHNISHLVFKINNYITTEYISNLVTNIYACILLYFQI